MIFVPDDGAYLGTGGACSSFSFAVLGDSHTHRTATVDEPAPELLRIIEELNLLRPAFVVSAGDLIRGYMNDVEKAEIEATGDSPTLEKRLRLEHSGAYGAYDKLAAPFYPCIGNHDVREPVSERVWRDIWGGRYYSFDYADCHFVVLDAEISKDTESVAGEQLEWLERDLAEHAVGKRLFVSLHRPWWYDVPLHTATWKHPGGRNDWNDIVDPILRQYNLQAIFCGHAHRFHVDYRNDVPHIITGGAGGEINDAPEIGGVVHYLWVSVQPNGFTWSVIVPGQILSPERIIAAEHNLKEVMPWLPPEMGGTRMRMTY
jgi:predicted phosphodiesterase